MMEIPRTHERKARLCLVGGQLLYEHFTKIVELLLFSPQAYGACVLGDPYQFGIGIRAGADKIRLRFQRIIDVE